MDIATESLKQCEGIDPELKVLVLSLTGSRAFGWGINKDYDVHGVYAKEGYWDHVHNGVAGIDLNLWELRHIVKMDIQYYHFELFQNLSNPIYTHPEFDYNTMMGFISSKGCEENAILQQYRMLKLQENPRTALHCYRIVMVRNHWLETKGEFELNVYKLSEKYTATQLDDLRDAYIEFKRFDNYDQVWKELDSLLEQFRELKRGFDRTIDKEEVDEWLEKTEKVFY